MINHSQFIAGPPELNLVFVELDFTVAIFKSMPRQPQMRANFDEIKIVIAKLPVTKESRQQRPKPGNLAAIFAIRRIGRSEDLRLASSYRQESEAEKASTDFL